MNFKPFYVHIRNCNGKGTSPTYGCRKHNKTGATVYVAPNEGRTIAVQVAFCAPHDQYCKKIGREQAQKEYKHIVNARDLPKVLGSIDDIVHGLSGSDPLSWTVEEYLHMLKYML